LFKGASNRTLEHSTIRSLCWFKEKLCETQQKLNVCKFKLSRIFFSLTDHICTLEMATEDVTWLQRLFSERGVNCFNEIMYQRSSKPRIIFEISPISSSSSSSPFSTSPSFPFSPFSHNPLIHTISTSHSNAKRMGTLCRPQYHGSWFAAGFQMSEAIVLGIRFVLATLRRSLCEESNEVSQFQLSSFDSARSNRRCKNIRSVSNCLHWGKCKFLKNWQNFNLYVIERWFSINTLSVDFISPDCGLMKRIFYI
jgi:hypothetical protein